MTTDRPDTAAIRARVDAATEGPWVADLDPHDETRGIWPTEPGEEIIIGSYVAADGYDTAQFQNASDDDLEFIAHARTDVPALLDALDAAHAAIDRVRDVVDDYDHLGPEAAAVASTQAWMHELRAALDPQEGQ